MRIVKQIWAALLCAAGTLAWPGADRARAEVIITKSDTPTLTAAADWGGVAPTAGEVGWFNGTLSAGNAAALALTGGITLDGLSFTNTLNGPVTVGATANSLTLGASGLDLSAANQNVTLGCALTLSAAQTWNSAKTLTVNASVVTGGNLLTLTNSLTGAIIVNGVISGAGGLTVAGLGTNRLAGANNYTGTTTVNGGSALAVQPGGLSSASPLALKNGATLQLRGDSSTAFTPASVTLDSAADIYNFDANSVSGTATGNTLTLNAALTFADSANQRINVTGNSTYTLGLGNLIGTTTGHNPYVELAINTLSNGASATIGSFQSGNWSQWLSLQGGGRVTVTGNLTNNSNGSSIVYVTDGTTATLQGRSAFSPSASGTADAYKYCVANGALLLDNGYALTNNTSGGGLRQLWPAQRRVGQHE
jgi:autotransporter-associated beta strand protein